MNGISRLAYGTASIHRVFSRSQREKLIYTAIDCGINHFDSSPFYGDGISEYTLGYATRKFRNNISIASKIGITPKQGITNNSLIVWQRRLASKLLPNYKLDESHWKVDQLEKSFFSSLKRLQTDYIDFLFLHEPELALMDMEKISEFLEKIRKQGYIIQYGVSGEGKKLLPFTERHKNLSQIIQTRDSLGKQEASQFFSIQDSIIYTYGYFSNNSSSIKLPTSDILKKALERNLHGKVIFSTNKISRLKEIIS